MPAYDYRCDACGGVFEVTQRMSDPVGASCPSCAAFTDHRLIGATSFILKGSGWYASDYKSGGSKRDAPAETAESEPATGGGCGKPACAGGVCAGASEA